MKNFSIFLLLLALFAVVVSSGVRERRSNIDENGVKAALELLQQAIEEGKLDINDLMDDKGKDPSRRLWFPLRIRWNGKK
ncbi:hypothetical protein ACJMK2_002729 [Sinanodonta woodiana]|uniref:Uncharacterized protein n=1 Tax=Sinanodonta woodiana TaxID=1069815 RepID=A0ABD3XW36_SINWO